MNASAFDVLVLAAILVAFFVVVAIARRSRKKSRERRRETGSPAYRNDPVAEAMVKLNPKWQARKQAWEAGQAAAAEADRRQELAARFGERDAERILAGEIWVGQPEGMLREALGEPEAVDERAQPGRKVQIWKYQPDSQGRYGLRIMLENGVVSSWSAKSR